MREGWTFGLAKSSAGVKGGDIHFIVWCLFILRLLEVRQLYSFSLPEIWCMGVAEYDLLCSLQGASGISGVGDAKESTRKVNWTKETCFMA